MAMLIHGASGGMDINLLLFKRGFNPAAGDPLNNVRRFFTEHPQEEWKGKNLQFRESSVSVVETLGDEDVTIRSIMQEALKQCPDRTELLAFWKSAEPLMKQLHIEEPTIKVLLQEENGLQTEYELPLSFCNKSPMLSAMFAGGFQESQSTYFKIILPGGVSKKTLDRYLSMSKDRTDPLSSENIKSTRLTSTDLLSLISVLLHFGLDEDLKTLEQNMQDAVFIQDLNTPESLLHAIEMMRNRRHELAGREFLVVGQFISSYIAQADTRRVNQIIETLSSIMIEGNPLSNYLCPCSLQISRSSISNEELQRISDLLPGMKKLELIYCLQVTALPREMKNLEKMRIDNSTTSVESATPALEDITGLANCGSLKELIMKNVPKIRSVPPGMVSLEKIIINDCSSLADISGLSSCPSLKTLGIRLTNGITTLPRGMISLEFVRLWQCQNLADINAFGDCKSLKKLIIGHVLAITSLPRGMLGLEELEIFCCAALENILALEDCVALKNLTVYASPQFRELPRGMVNLEILNIDNSCLIEETIPALEDITGLENCRSLKKLIMKNVPKITALPRGMVSLEEMGIVLCANLEEISALEGSNALKKLEIVATPKIRALPEKMASLQELTISCTDHRITLLLEDVTALRSCRSLKKLSIVNARNIRVLPEGMVSLEAVYFFECSGLTDITVLENCRSLRVLTIRGCEGISALPERIESLEELRIHCSYALTDVSVLARYPSLKTLFMSAAGVRILPSDMRNLEKLTIDDRYIPEGIILEPKDISGLGSCRSLKKLALQNCSDLQGVSNLKDSRELVDIEGDFPIPDMTRCLLIANRQAKEMDYSSLISSLSSMHWHQIHWGCWFFSGMPQGDPQFGRHLLEDDPKNAAIQESFRHYLDFGTRFLREEVIAELHALPEDLRNAEGDSEKRRAIMGSLSEDAALLLKRAIWRAEGMRSRDPDFAGHLMERDPCNEVIDRMVLKIVRSLLTHGISPSAVS